MTPDQTFSGEKGVFTLTLAPCGLQVFEVPEK